MRMRIALLLAVSAALPLAAEYKFFTPPGSFAAEVSLDNAPFPRLPIYRNAITSLDVVGDNAIGGTTANSGLSPYLFAVSLSKQKLGHTFDLATVLPGQRAIQSGFGRGPDGILYAGTMPDERGGSGHLISLRLTASGFDVKDFGAPVAGEGIFAITADPKAGAVYGVTHPSGKFFVYDLKSGGTVVYDQATPSREDLRSVRQYGLKPEDVLPRRLIVDRSGRVYGSKAVGAIFRYDPLAKKVEMIGELPDVWGRRPLGRVDSWAVAPDGTIYGGNAGDGQLFRIDPSTGQVTNLGKPAMMPRMKGLAFGADGKLYGVTGAAPGYAHLFSYDPKGAGFVDLGNPRFTMTEPGIEQGIAWRGFQIGTLAASEDGRFIVMGEEEALSQMMVFPVGSAAAPQSVRMR